MNFDQKINVTYKSIVCVSILLMLFSGDITNSNAQQAFWSTQQKIPEYYDSTEEPPYLIADQNHTIHAFNSQPLDLSNPDSHKAIFYRQWRLENGWTFPNDILVDIDGVNMNLLGVAVDGLSRVHLVIQKGDAIYYIQNYLADANSAAMWSSPLLIAETSSLFATGFEIISALATDPDGNEIMVIYSGKQTGNGLYFTKSSDGGSNWTEPYPIYLTGDEDIIVTDPKLYKGESGIFHAVWSTFLKSGAGGPSYYANFDPTTNSWSQPLELDTPGIRTPSVIEYHGDVIVSYYHANVNGNWWRLSSDGGKTWTYPTQISALHVGTNGAVSFVVDSSDHLHAFYGERTDDNNHGIWHSIWAMTAWTKPDAVVRGPQIKDVVGGKGFDPRSARAVIVNGNVVLVTWGTDGAGGVNGAWYSYRQLDTPELPTLVLPIPSSIAEQISTEEPSLTTEIAKAESTPNSLPENFLTAPRSTGSPGTSVFIGILPALLVLLGIIFSRYIHYFRNK
jgi:hypothetical protein